MRMLSATELLGVWERGRVQGPIEQALLLLATACPDTPIDELARLSIGTRDHALLTLRDWTFGRAIVSVTNCAQCGEQLELEFDAAGLCPESGSVIAVSAEQPVAEHTYHLDTEGYSVRFRCANSHDLTALTASIHSIAETRNNHLRGRTLLLERCILTAQRDGVRVSVSALPDKVVDTIASRMAEADPYADLQLAASCPTCGNQWHAMFDAVTYFWSEIDSWARCLLHDVHLLARAYGWREEDVLNLSPLRRQCYLDMVAA